MNPGNVTPTPGARFIAAALVQRGAQPPPAHVTRGTAHRPCVPTPPAGSRRMCGIAHLGGESAHLKRADNPLSRGLLARIFAHGSRFNVERRRFPEWAGLIKTRIQAVWPWTYQPPVRAERSPAR
jgi:hypothetical protein